MQPSERACPFCEMMCDADWCDVGLGPPGVQSGPYHCMCGASEVGPHDEVNGRATQYGWYLPGSPAGTSVNTCGGAIVGHKDALRLYRRGLLDEKPDQGREGGKSC